MAFAGSADARRGGLGARTVPSSVVCIGVDGGCVLSGALIGSNWVLTVHRGLGGVLRCSVDRGDGEKVRVDRQYRAPAGDMALLRLVSPLEGGRIGGVVGEGYIPLAAGSDPSPEGGDRVFAMGYGGGGLEVAEQRIASYGPDGSYGMTGSASAVGGAAFVGDAGGPVLRADGKGGLTLIGVVSGGTVYAEGDSCVWFAGGPTVWSTDGNGVMNRDWIQNTTGI
ncbi:S1 family peptidase [Streptomyces tubercidicus]|uniref:S1 family peptidase n=1 Tax=Streptomyces tubercidicus TaxID=47759 RepID=UPI0036751503